MSDFDLVKYIQTEAKGVRFKEVLESDHRVTDFHIVQMKAKNGTWVSGMFKDARCGNVFVQWDFMYIRSYGRHFIISDPPLYQTGIAKTVHAIIDCYTDCEIEIKGDLLQELFYTKLYYTLTEKGEQ